VKGLDGCRLVTSWYPSGSGSTLSGDVTCNDGNVVAVDITFDSSNKVTKLIGQGIDREFDSTVVGSKENSASITTEPTWAFRVETSVSAHSGRKFMHD
jgi:hypothetical protein